MGSRLTTTESMYRKKPKHYIGVQNCIKSKDIFKKKKKKEDKTTPPLFITDLVPSQLFFHNCIAAAGWRNQTLTHLILPGQQGPCFFKPFFQIYLKKITVKARDQLF